MFEWLVAKNVTCCFCSNSDIISACFLFVNNFFIFLKSFIADFWNNFSCYRLTLFASLVNSFFYFFILLLNSAFCVRHSRGECYISIVNFRCQPFFYFFSKTFMIIRKGPCRPCKDLQTLSLFSPAQLCKKLTQHGRTFFSKNPLCDCYLMIEPNDRDRKSVV